MKQHYLSKTVRLRARLIDQLLKQPTIALAAEAAGMSLSTAWRIRSTPEFQREFRAACEEVHRYARFRAQFWSGSAISVLAKALTEAPWSARVKAAKEIAALAHQAAEQNELDEHGRTPSTRLTVDISLLTEEQLSVAHALALAARKKDHAK